MGSHNITFMVIYYTICYVLFSCTVHVLCSYTGFLLYFSYYFLFYVLYLFIYFSCTAYTFLYDLVSSYTLHLYFHFDYRSGIHDRFKREPRPVCHLVAM